MTMQDAEFTINDLTESLPKSTSLYYVDYRDNLNEHIDLLQQCYDAQEWQPLDESIFEWFLDSERESMQYYLQELSKELLDTYDLTDEEAQELLEKFNTELEDEIRERDTSNPLDDLLRHTTNPVMFCDTGLEVDSESWAWDNKELRRWLGIVKRKLQIPAKNHKFDRAINELLCNATYGGRLVVYFTLDLRRDFKDFLHLSDYNTVQFTNPEIAIIDTYNGSGHNVSLPGHVCQFKLDKDNFTFEKTVKYNYTYQVCGMNDYWCEDTQYLLCNTSKPRKVRKSSIGQEKSLENEYAATYKAGKCTLGDTDMKRHRQLVYVNDFPCGTHCKACGQFWID